MYFSSVAFLIQAWNNTFPFVSEWAAFILSSVFRSSSHGRVSLKYVGSRRTNSRKAYEVYNFHRLITEEKYFNYADVLFQDT